MNIGLVLSGGMAKGAYQIGALRAISEFIPKDEIKFISCSSVGVLNGYSFATDKLDKVEDIWRNLCNNDTRLYITRILRSSMLQQSIKSLYSDDDKLSSAFYCTLLDGIKNEVVYKNLQSVANVNIADYLKASVAMPIYNKAVFIDKKYYFDGAMIDNIPVYPLLKHKVDYIICVYFDDTSYKFESTYFDNKVIKITFPTGSIIRQSLIFTESNILKMIDEGFERTKKILSEILKNGYEDLDYIYNTIEQKNKNENRVIRITGDVLVTNLNKIAQKFAKRKII